MYMCIIGCGPYNYREVEAERDDTALSVMKMCGPEHRYSGRGWYRAAFP